LARAEGYVIDFKVGQSFGEPQVKPGVDAEVLATTAAWAIFGAARRWYQTSDRIPAEEMAAKIEAMVKPIFLGVSA
jgi:hypothetical protein